MLRTIRVLIDEPIDVIAGSSHVQIEVQARTSGAALYVHIDGITVLRVCRIETRKLSLVDEFGLLKEEKV